ncbi:KH domain-containing protein [Acidianus sp. RZ1]|uniref:KH domain-containing protein n=1 Tax=Acidianus sp. RZ1 TaxID=1540082 RepID=UPI00149314D2|nr:KH domain-containing protein [Acidianus sp. RZ1]NON63252.1 RNA-processing protein [Acidianus sp. RZ1]
MFVTVSDEKLNEARNIATKLEQMTDIEIIYDDRLKTFNVNPKGNAYEAIKVVSVFNAIDLDFTLDEALKLLADEYYLDIIDLKKSFGNNPSVIRRIKGRVIGENGKTKKIIQEYTGCNISISKHSIAILGLVEQVPIARRAIEMLIDGKEHSTVYKYLDKAEAELIAFSKNRFKDLK